MSLVVNTNLSSLNAQRYLNNNQASLTSAMQRLSSGLRINSAKDDAAGFSIAQRMTSQITGNMQATRNANDGISMTQTAEGDLKQIGANLQRIRELAVQASNSSNSASDRAAIQNESTQLVAEIDRVATNSSFNGTKLLDGSFNNKSFQVGANSTADNQITIAAISSAKTSSLGVGAGSSYATTAPSAGSVSASALAVGDLIINGIQVGATVSDGVSNTTPSSSGIAKAAAINAVSSQTNVTATVGQTTVAGTTNTAGTAILDGDIAINGVNIGAISVSSSPAERGSQVAAAVNAKTSQTGVTATFDTTTGAVALNATDGRNITIGTGTTAAGAVGAGVAANISGLASSTVQVNATTGLNTTSRSVVTLSSSDSKGITIAAGAADGAAASGLTAGYTAASATVGAGISSLDFSTTAGAQAALVTIDAAINTVNTTSASLGAYQNRFASTITSLQTTTENLTTSRSRIQDADFAQESANLSRAQVLQQAGTAMLAQANQSAQGVLSLLR